jgi:hypothetical protein
LHLSNEGTIEDPEVLVLHQLPHHSGHAHVISEVAQRFYADIDAADAGRRLCEAWQDKKSNGAKNILIE